MTKSTEFRAWLAQEVEHVGSAREVARRSKKRVSHAWISKVLGGDEPSYDFCAGVAHGLGYSPVDVMVRAGLIEPKEVFTALSESPSLRGDRQADEEQRLFALWGLIQEERRGTLLEVAAALAGQPTPEQQNAPTEGAQFDEMDQAFFEEVRQYDLATEEGRRLLTNAVDRLQQANPELYRWLLKDLAVLVSKTQGSPLPAPVPMGHGDSA